MLSCSVLVKYSTVSRNFLSKVHQYSFMLNAHCEIQKIRSATLQYLQIDRAYSICRAPHEKKREKEHVCVCVCVCKSNKERRLNGPMLRAGP